MVAADVHRRRRSRVRRPSPAAGRPPSRRAPGASSTSVAARDRSRGASPGWAPTWWASIPRRPRSGKHARGGGPVYARARAEALPCREGAFDVVVACLAFEHVAEIDSAMHEVARVLEPGGRFVLLLGHPLLQAPRSGWVDDQSVGGTTGASVPISESTPKSTKSRPREPEVRAPSDQPLRTRDGERGHAHRRHGRATTVGEHARGSLGLPRSVDHPPPSVDPRPPPLALVRWGDTSRVDDHDLD